MEKLAFQTLVQSTKYVYIFILLATTVLYIAYLGEIPLKVHFQDYYTTRILKLMLYSGLTASTWFLLKKSPDKWCTTAGAALLHVGGLGLFFRVVGLGDEYNWRVWFSQSNHLPASEILSIFVYRIAYLTNFPLGLIAPFCGFLNLFVILITANRIAGALGRHTKNLRSISYLFYAASPMSFLYLPGYIETTLISLPALYMALIHLLEFVGPMGRSRDLFLSTLWFFLACFIHGLSVALLPLLPIACILRFKREPNFSLFCKRLSICILIACVCIFIASLLLNIFGFPISKLNKGIDNTYSEINMFSRSHGLLIVNILFITMPTFPLWWIIFGSKFWLKLQANLEPYVLLIASNVGFYCFTILYGFDLGFPQDTDIMISLGIIIPLFFTALYAGLREWRLGLNWVFSLTLLNGSLTWWTLTPTFRAGLVFNLLH